MKINLSKVLLHWCLGQRKRRWHNLWCCHVIRRKVTWQMATWAQLSQPTPPKTDHWLLCVCACVCACMCMCASMYFVCVCMYVCARTIVCVRVCVSEMCICLPRLYLNVRYAWEGRLFIYFLFVDYGEFSPPEEAKPPSASLPAAVRQPSRTDEHPRRAQTKSSPSTALRPPTTSRPIARRPAALPVCRRWRAED